MSVLSNALALAGSGKGSGWTLDPLVPGDVFPNEHVELALLRTRKRNTIPVFLFTCPGARYTLIVSHGNATDCGAMWLRYAQLCTYLRVNVCGYDYSGYGAATALLSSHFW